MPPAQTVKLGPFELDAMIGQGGMGQVWRGVHTAQRVPVAIKVITRDYARQEKYLTGFRSEVRALAQLDHPGIVMVFDYGEIPTDTAEASQGLLAEGSPYLVMEYASQGSLSRIRGPLAYSELKGILGFLLDVLAHAHARGVIHRDLKPANILFSGPDDIRPGPKLTDFGIAFALDAAVQGYLAKGSLGSPAYMAPEQWFGDWRDYGPWTDLYALGCIAFQLATGAPPFPGDDALRIANAHMSEPPPRFGGTLPLPEGFEGWVRRLLSKEPHHRFQRAQDAATALFALAESHPVEPVAPHRLADRLEAAEVPDEDVSPTVVSGEPSRGEKAGPTAVLLPQPSLARRSSFAGDRKPEELPCCAIPLATVPSTWMKGSPSIPSIRLVGVGLGLFGLRAVPLVDRRSELDKLWASLIEVAEDRRPRLVVLQGPAGCGKSRLAQWMCERAHELGAATILKAVHSPIAGPGAGLARMLARHFQCIGLPRHDILQRTRRLLGQLGSLDEYEWNGLAELMESTDPGQTAPGAPIVRFTSSTQRYALIQCILERVSQERPVIVWLDDVQWAMDSLQFAEYMVVEPVQRPLPVLLLLTAQEQALAERPMEAQKLVSLLKRRRTRQLPVGPLDQPHRAELVRNLLFLEGDLADQVEKRSGGNPMFAIQLIGDWVRRGVLQVGPRGFVLRPGERAVLPDDIHMVWVASLERMLDEYAQARCAAGMLVVDVPGKRAGLEETRAWVKQDTRCVLEVAAALGQVIDRFEWQQVASQMGLSCPSDLPDALMRSHLAYPHEAGWTLAHGLFRESLERLAREAGRWEEINAACAAMLVRCYPDRPRGIAGRVGLHLVQAGDHAGALQPLLDAARERSMQTDYPQATSLLDLRDTSLDQLGAPADDLRRAEGWLVRSRILIHQAEFNSARAWADRGSQAARKAGDKGILAESLQLVGLTNLWRGQLKPAAELFGRALELYRQARDRKGTGRTLFHLGSTLLQQGEWDQAQRCFEEALQISYQVPDWETWADSLRKLALVALKQEDLPRATSLNQQALEYYNREGNRYGVAACWNSLGNIRLSAGDLGAAEEAYRQVLLLLGSIGVYGEMIGTQLNLCIILLETGQYEAARRELAAVLESCRERGVRVYLGAAHSLALVAAAGILDWTAWNHHHAKAAALLEETGQANSDVAWALQMAGDLARKAQENGRAQQAFTLALACYQRLGDSHKVAEVQQALASCSNPSPDEGDVVE